jgi:short-subunit dehydrogenase
MVLSRVMKIAGSNILVTGASSGIGAALAPLLASKGATVGIVARRKEKLEAVLEQCREHAPDSALWAADLSDLDTAERVANEAWDALDGVDCLVNNAAIPKRTPVQRLTREEVDDVMRINFTSPIRMTLALLPRWLERDKGCVVNVSSMGGRLGIAHEAAYCASKFALCGWSESMAIDLHETGVEVKLALPGPIETEI